MAEFIGSVQAEELLKKSHADKTTVREYPWCRRAILGRLHALQKIRWKDELTRN